MAMDIAPIDVVAAGSDSFNVPHSTRESHDMQYRFPAPLRECITDPCIVTQ